MSAPARISQAASGPIKIGVSGNPQSRLKNLQVGIAEKLTLLATVPGGRFTEAQIQQRLIAHRLHGEWFAPHAEVLRVIENFQTQNGPMEDGYPRTGPATESIGGSNGC